MNGRYLLDTNIVIALFADEPSVRKRLGRANEVFVPGIVLGELYYGAMKSTRMADNVARIEQFAVQMTILVCDADTARAYGSAKSLLREKGRPIPENDLWIAAVALQHDLTLVARDAHFAHVDGLRLEEW